MKPIKSQQGKKKVRQNTQNQTNRTPQISSGTSRLNNTNNTILSNIQINDPLYGRELSLPSIINDNYAAKVSTIIKSFALGYIELINQVLKSGNKSAFLIQATANDSIVDLAAKGAEGYSNICKYGLKELYYLEQSFQMIEIDDTSNPEVSPNAQLCWRTLCRIFEKYFEYKIDENVDLVFQFTKSQNDIIVHNINHTITDAIKDLVKIKNECYFSLFRKMMDPNLNLETKYLTIIAYTGEKDLLNASSMLRICSIYELDAKLINARVNFLDQVIGTYIRNLACYVSKLQNLLDCFNKIKHAPKTVYNLIIARKILKKCYDFYAEDLEKVKVIQINQPTSQYCQDYFRVKNFLMDLDKKLAAPIEVALREKFNPSSISIHTSYQERLNIQTEQETQNEKNQVLNAGSYDATQSTSSTTISNNSQMDNCLEEKDLTTGTPISIQSKDLNIIEICGENTNITLDEKSDEDGLDDIESEGNELMEMLRQLFDKDRAAKLELKKAKLNKSKIELEKKENLESSTIKPKSSIQTLNTKHQETIQAVFQTKPGHLTIWGKDVKSLIKALGGKSCGATGSQFTIFWNGSSKHAGEYEITHGGDKPGYLTSEYATRVADAIHIGLKYNCIERGLFPQELLTIIEIHVLSSNDEKK